MAGEIRSFRDLIAWQKGIVLCKQIYVISAEFPDVEKFGLRSQVRRAAVSIPSNIAEGYGRRRKQDYLRFLDMARGSLCEVETQMILAQELSFVEANRVASCMELIREVDRILYALARSVKNSKPLER